MRIAMCANVLKTVEHLLIPQGLFENLHPLLTVKILRFEGNLFYVKGLTATVTIWYIKDKVFPIHAKKAQLYGFSTSTLPLCPFSMRLGGLQNRSGHFDNIKMQYALSSFQFFFFSVAQQPDWALAASFLMLLDLTQLGIHTYPLRLLRRLHRPLPTQHGQTQETNIHILNGIRSRNLSSQADSDLRPRLHGRQYSLLSLTVRVKFTRRLKQRP